MELMGNLEIHAWHGCNLFCESCSHYSSLGLRGGPSPTDCDAWMSAWSRRLRPETFSILGGEPAANPELSGIVDVAIRRWPECEIRLVTNGFLLHRHPDLPRVMTRASRAVLVVSSHHSGTDYQAQFARVRNLVEDWRQSYGLNTRIVEADRFWTKRYDTTSDGVAFFASDPRAAWKACVGKYCTQLFDGKLWKCPPVAYFDLLAGRRAVGNDARALRDGYFPLTPDCSDRDLKRFLSREEESICTICPERPEPFALPSPLRPGGPCQARSGSQA
jgi:radical SAM family protein